MIECAEGLAAFFNLFQLILVGDEDHELDHPQQRSQQVVHCHNEFPSEDQNDRVNEGYDKWHNFQEFVLSVIDLCLSIVNAKNENRGGEQGKYPWRIRQDLRILQNQLK